MMNYEEIKKFIEDNDIEKRIRLREEYRKVYDCFKKLSSDEQEILLPSKPSNYSNLNTADDFKRFIKTNNITDRFMFQHKFTGAYTRFKNLLTNEEQEYVFPLKVRPLYTSLKTVEDFNQFALENDVKNRIDLQDRFYAAYKRFLKLTKEEQDSIQFTKPYASKYAEIKSPTDFQEFIDNNQIFSKSQFAKEFGALYQKYRRLPKEEISLVHFKNDKPTSLLNTLSDFQKIVDDNNLKTFKEFREQFSKEYQRYLKVIPEQGRNLVFPPSDKNPLDSLDDFQRYINENHIMSYREFRLKHKTAYAKYLNKRPNWSKFDLVFPEEVGGVNFGSNHSTGEIFLMKLFDENNINFEMEKTFSDLKYTSYLRYDFYLPDLNVLVEYHGEHHFGEGIYYEEDVIIHDKIKFDYAKNNNIPIIYYTNSKRVYEKKGYFTEVITDSDILIKKIKEISLTN